MDFTNCVLSKVADPGGAYHESDALFKKTPDPAVIKNGSGSDPRKKTPGSGFDPR